MKIGEARQFYSQQQNTLYEQQKTLSNKLQDDKMSHEEKKVILELSNQVSNAYEKTSDFLNGLTEYESVLLNQKSVESQGEAMEEATENMSKCLEVARRIAKGDKVPPEDEKKLMEFSSELYMQAKNIAVMNRNRKRKEYDSLWEEEEKTEGFDMEKAQAEIAEKEAPMAAPEVAEFDISEE